MPGDLTAIARRFASKKGRAMSTAFLIRWNSSAGALASRTERKIV